MTRVKQSSAPAHAHRRSFPALMAAAALIAPGPSRAESVADWQPVVSEASARFGVPREWINRVMGAESRGRTTLHGRPIRSSAGAIGLMQLMPLTWATMRDMLRLGEDPDDPHDNIIAGTAYLRQLSDRFGYPGMIAAYNAGPARYAAYLARRQRLPAETVAYLNAVTGTPRTAQITPLTRPTELMFVLRRDLSKAAPAVINPAENDGIFAIQRSSK